MQPLIFMFSGQGSQYPRMGQELYTSNARFRFWMDECDAKVYRHLHRPLVEILYGERSYNYLERVLYSNPALLCVEYSLAQMLMEQQLQPAYLLGYSLGEITASVIAGAMSLDDAICLTIEYAKLLEAESEPAAMLAILGAPDLIDRFSQLFRDCWVTGRNFHSHFVVSGSLRNIEQLERELTGARVLCQRLPVYYGFHTELMDPLEARFKALANGIDFKPLQIPVISAVRAETIRAIDGDYLWSVLRYPVEFEKTVRYMLGRGDYGFIDVGPSGSLANFVKYALPRGSCSAPFETINQFGRNLLSLDKLVSALPRGTETFGSQFQ